MSDHFIIRPEKEKTPGESSAQLAQIARRLAPVVAFAVFALAVWLLSHSLRQFHFRDLTRATASITGFRLLLSFLLTCLGYFVSSGYDLLALRYIRQPLALSRIILASFISYAFANNTGSLSIITSSGVRYRFYGAWGLSTLEIGEVVLFSMATFWLGFLTLGGASFLLAPLHLPASFHLQAVSFSVLGAIFLAAAAVYLVACAVRKQPLRIKGWEIVIPGFSLALQQVAVAVTDLLFAAGVLYVLLPSEPGLSFMLFLSIYLSSLLIGLISNVPGGLGVFEAAMLLQLGPFLPGATILGALLVYRAIYFILPLGLASVVLAGQELLRRKSRIGGYVAAIGRTTSGLVPPVLAAVTFISGAALLFSGATPAITARVAMAKTFLPLPLLELSHFLASIIGLVLLVLASGIYKRLDAAYFLAVFLLLAGAALSLLKGLDYEEALLLLGVLAVLLPCRRQFYRKASLLDEPFSPGWLGAISIVLLGSIWIGFFSYKHVEYSTELWWHFTFAGDGPRFLRATVGVAAVAFLLALAKLLRAARAKPAYPDDNDLTTAMAIASRFPYSYAYLALLGDKELLFNDDRSAFLMFGARGRSLIAMGDPVGSDQDIPELLWQFKDLCDQHAGLPVFYEVNRKNLHLYLDLGLTPLKIGEQGRVSLKDFSLDGSARKVLRHSRRQVTRQGCSFEVIGPEEVDKQLPILRSISDAWLADKNAHEKGFSLGFFEDRYLRRFPAAIVRRDNDIIAFANLLPGAEKYELSVDLMRYLSNAPHGVMDFLFVEIMLWAKEQGYSWFDMGMAPLAGLENTAAAMWPRVGAFIFRHGEHFYNFQGLRHYKNKFAPTWEPKYLVSPAGLALPRILADTTALIAGGTRGIFLK